MTEIKKQKSRWQEFKDGYRLEDIEDLRPKPGQAMRTWLLGVMETNIGIVTTFFWLTGCVFWLWLTGTFVYRIFHSFFLNR